MIKKPFETFLSILHQKRKHTIQGFHGNVNVELIFQIKDMDNSNDIPIQTHLKNF